MATLPLSSSSSANGGVLVASSDASLREQIVANFNVNRWPVLAADGGADALDKLESSECDVLLLDRQLSDLDSDELIGLIEAQYPGVEILQIDARTRNLTGMPRKQTPGVQNLFALLERLTDGSTDVPRETVRTAIDLELGGENLEALPGMVGANEVIQSVYRMVRLVARRRTTVLVTGPTGSGKELVARAVHELSPRSKAPFVVINCAAIPEALLEAELFGYTRGAFTGAVQSRAGRVQSAQGGTIFLDEIGDLPLGLQAKLLRFLERGEIQRLGSNDVFRVDVRIVAATNAELIARVEKGEFREDLYYRLSVFPIELPPLGARRSDIPLLAEHFLARLAPEYPVQLAIGALRKLESHAWPGNVRELIHVLERALILSDGAPMINPEHIFFSAVPMTAESLPPRKAPACA
jgi:DNA-binding NtrC family response regulator